MIPQLVMLALVAAGSFYPAPAITKADVEPAPVIAQAPVEKPAPAAAKKPQPVVEKEVRTMYVTAYTSSPEETDDTPFITASGTHVRDGIVATNELPMGTKIKIPAAYGDKIFVVEDRMHPRMVNKIDIWMAEKEQALHFGIRKMDIVVLK